MSIIVMPNRNNGKPGEPQQCPFCGFAFRTVKSARDGKLIPVQDAFVVALEPIANIYHPKTGEPILTDPEQPIRWRKHNRVFVNSMGDLFHEDVPNEFIDEVFAVMALAGKQTFLVLTKRAERMREYFSERKWYDGDTFTYTRDFFVEGEAQSMYAARHPEERDTVSLWLAVHWPLPNVHLGISCEDQATADERIPPLLDTPAAVRFVSLEPLLGPISLREIQHNGVVEIDALTGNHGVNRPLAGRSELKLDHVIVGGESGPGARPMHPAWVRDLRDQCIEADAAFFFKQWGDYAKKAFAPWPLAGANRVAKKGGRLLDGRTWDEMPEARP